MCVSVYKDNKLDCLFTDLFFLSHFKVGRAKMTMLYQSYHVSCLLKLPDYLLYMCVCVNITVCLF